MLGEAGPSHLARELWDGLGSARRNPSCADVWLLRPPPGVCVWGGVWQVACAAALEGMERGRKGGKSRLPSQGHPAFRAKDKGAGRQPQSLLEVVLLRLLHAPCYSPSP